MNSRPTDIFFSLIIFQLLFLSLFLLTQKKGKWESNRLLGSFFLAICLNLLDYFLLQTGSYDRHPGLAGWGICLPLLFGPFIYLYTESVIYKGFYMHLKTAWHFLPFLLLFAGTEYYYLTYSRVEQENILYEIRTHHFPIAITITSTVIFIQFLIYTIAALRLVFRYKIASVQYFSNRKSADVKWLYTTLIFFIVIIIISALNGIFVQTQWAKYYLYLFNFVILALLIYVVRILLKALRKPDFFTISRDDNPKFQDPGSRLKDQPTRDNSETGKIAKILLLFVENKKPYLNPELTLDQLAMQLSLKPRVLSNVINDELGHSFYDFINRYRINEASRLLTKPKDKKITILEVLYEVGFNSKSSFNTLFKKYTGLTPSEFKKKNLL
jgi:AraC-like DNA-binding protein